MYPQLFGNTQWISCTVYSTINPRNTTMEVVGGNKILCAAPHRRIRKKWSSYQKCQRRQWCIISLAGESSYSKNILFYSRFINNRILGNSHLYNSEQEKELILLIAEGDEHAFSILINRYANRIYPYLIHWLKQAQLAEEILQDLFISLWKNRHKLPTIDNFPGYIFVVTRNRTNTALKQQLLAG